MFPMLPISEKTIERRLVNGIKKLGGLCLKFVSPGSIGVPDRLIITANGETIFAELKTDTGRLSRPQQHMINRMRRLGAEVWVLYGLEDVKKLLTVIEQRKSDCKGGEAE